MMFYNLSSTALYRSSPLIEETLIFSSMLPSNMVEVGLMEIALLGVGLAIGYVLGKMNGSGAKKIDKSDHSTTDNRKIAKGAISGDHNQQTTETKTRKIS
jgi:uncharacterized membrane protein